MVDLGKLESRLRDSGYHVRTRDYSNRDNILGEEGLRAEAIKLKEEGRGNLTALGSSLRALFNYVTCGGEGSTKEMTSLLNDFNLERMGGGESLVFLVHGLSVPGFKYDGRKFALLRKQFEEVGIRTFAQDYDYTLPFEEYSEQVYDSLVEIVRGVPSPERMVCLGQSTGGDVLRYIVAKADDRLTSIGGYIFAAPTTNGKRVDIGDKCFFGKKTDYCNPESREGQKIIPVLQSGFSENGITISCLRDAFIPLESSLDSKGKNLLVGGFGHLAQTGVNRKFNELYMDVVDEMVGIYPLPLIK